MDFDFSILIYLFGALIYFILQGGKKKGKKPRPSRPRQVTPPPVTTRESKQPTFEELLQEFTGQQTVREAPEPVVEPAPPPVPTFKQIKEPGEGERSITTAYDDVSHRSMSSPFERFEEFDHTADEESVLDDLKDPEAARKAFIYSEIFKRKY